MRVSLELPDPLTQRLRQLTGQAGPDLEAVMQEALLLGLELLEAGQNRTGWQIPAKAYGLQPGFEGLRFDLWLDGLDAQRTLP